jgi:imidazolonepropionase
MTDNQKQNTSLDTPVCDSLWINANIATMAQGGLGIIENAALAVDKGKIRWIGSMEQLKDVPENQAPKIHDAKGMWLTPGLIDCHTHLVYAGNRAGEFAMRMEGKSYADIAKAGGGIMSSVRATREASEDELFRSSEKRLRSLLKEGVTTVEIKSGYGLEMESELKMLRVARELGRAYSVNVQTTFLGAHAIPPEYAGKADDYITMLCDEMMPAVAKENLADAVDAYCETIAFSPDQVMKLFTAAKRLGLAVKLHAGQMSDMGGVEVAAHFHALSAEHLEHVSEKGIEAMAKAGTVAVLLPGAFYSLRETKKPPVEKFRAYSVPMALATDSNPGTSPVGSLLLMLNMGCVLFGFTAQEALQGVTINAAKALGLQHKIGSLEVGKDADMALWDITHPSELAYHTGYNPCIGVVRHGQFMDIRERLA